MSRWCRAAADKLLADGGRITETQGSVSLELLLGRFIFSVTQMNGSQSQSQNAGRRRPSRPADEPRAARQSWPGADGAPLSCREKLKVLAENHAELAQVMRDAFEDAVLMGVDEAAMRRILSELVQALPSPKRRT